MKRYAASAASLVSAFALPAGAEVLDSIAEYGNAAGANATSDAGTARGALYEDPTAGAYSITAGGTDIWGNNDNGTFIYDADQTRAAGEDFSVIVRSVSIAGDPAEGVASEWGRTGLMARVDVADAGSPNVAHIRKSGTNNHTVIQGRNNAGQGTDRGPGNNGQFTNESANGNVRTTALWLGLHRFDGQWYATWANDAAGTPGTWSDARLRDGTANTQGEVYVGLAHQSHGAVHPNGNTALFDNFSVGAFDPSFGNFPPASVSCDIALDASGPAVTVSGGSEIGNTNPAGSDLSEWELRYNGLANTNGVLATNIYLASNPGNLAGAESIIANGPNGSTEIESIHWAGNAYTTTNAEGVNLFAEAVPGQFGGDQSNYGVEMTGEIHIPSDTDRGNVESIKFKDGCDDFCYLEIDGVPLINDNAWSNLAGTGNGGGAQKSLDVSDAKYDDGEWVSFRMIFWEGGGGDDCILLWDALDLTGTDSVTGGTDATTSSYLGGADGTKVSFAHDFSDKIPSENFRAVASAVALTVPGNGDTSAELLTQLPAGTVSLELYVNGELCESIPTIVSTSGASFTAPDEFTMTIDDTGQGGVADVDTASLTATLNGDTVNPAILKVGTVTTLTYTFTTPPLPNTDYALVVSGMTTAGTGSAPFTVGATAKSFPFLVGELRPGLAAPPNSTVGWDYMEFDVRSVFPGGVGPSPGGFARAQTVISTAAAPRAQAIQPYINHSDPENRGQTGDWLPDLPILSDTAGDDNDFVIYARTTITIDAGSEGDYTFRVTGDDGFGLRIGGGAVFRDVSGQAQNELHPIDKSVVYRPPSGGNGNMMVVCNFPEAGDYLVEFFGYEGGGGAYQELSWTSGAVNNLNSLSWALLGNTSEFAPVSLWGDIPEAGLPPLPSGGETGWSTYVYYNASVGNLNNTMNYLRGADPGTATATILPELNHADNGGNAGRFNPSAAFPGDPNPGGGTDNVALIARANIVVPVTGDYTIQVRSDDGFMLRFTDPANAFSSLAGSGSIRAAAPNEVFFPSGTGDSNTRATINLQEGVHELVYVWWEGGGGAHFEVSSAPGVVPDQNGPYELLSNAESLTNLYVGGGESDELVISSVTYDKSNDNYSLTFNSEAGASYTIDSDTDLDGFETEVDDNVSGTGEDVTYGPFLSPFPGTGKVFFRVRRN